MKTVFSSQLIERCRRIFKAKSGQDISVDQAELYLEKLARLGLLMVKLHTQTKKGGEKV